MTGALGRPGVQNSTSMEQTHMSDHEHSDATGDVTRRLRELIHGYTLTQAVYAAAKLCIPDHLDDRPRDCRDLACRTATDPDSLCRLMRALASIGVFYEDETGRYTLTEVGRLLCSNTPASLRVKCCSSAPSHIGPVPILFTVCVRGRPRSIICLA